MVDFDLYPVFLDHRIPLFHLILNFIRSHLSVLDRNLPPEVKESWQILIVTPVFAVIILSNAIMTLSLMLDKKTEALPRTGLDNEHHV